MPCKMQLLDIEVCGLHVVHGSKNTELASVSWELHIFLKPVYNVFEDALARRSFSYIQNELFLISVKKISGASTFLMSPNIFSFFQKHLPKTQAVETSKTLLKKKSSGISYQFCILLHQNFNLF